MRRLPVLLLLGFVATPAHGEPATRVVSLDYCADQYVLELLPRENILALSPDAEQDFAYHRERAAGMPSVRPVAEDILALQPTLLVRSYGGGPLALAFFERAGIPVVQVPFADDIDGIRSAVTAVAAELGAAERGTAVVADMDARLAAIEGGERDRSALYLSAGGATSGPGTLVHALLEAAGFDNYESRPGWHSVPLEQLVDAEPDVVVASFFGGAAERTAWWSAMRHPVARRQLSTRPTVLLPGALTACGAWFAVDAVEMLAEAR